MIGFVLFAMLMFVGYVRLPVCGDILFREPYRHLDHCFQGGADRQAAALTIGGLPKPAPVAMRATLPPTIIDSENFGTENNWIASTIAERVADFAHLATQPG